MNRLFLSTPSARRATARPSGRAICYLISIHALREEGDHRQRQTVWKDVISIHALREEGDGILKVWKNEGVNFYPRPPRGGRPYLLSLTFTDNEISIHALREEGDNSPFELTTCPRDFYPRPPRGGRPGCRCRTRTSGNFYPRPPRGGRPKTTVSEKLSNIFLSTPSARRATARRSRMDSTPSNFYPRPPRGGRLLPAELDVAVLDISIHALREEGDPCSDARRGKRRISIHALREEGDLPENVSCVGLLISIHALREEGDLFQGGLAGGVLISIHALREEGDRARMPTPSRSILFLSTPSARRATSMMSFLQPWRKISIHALREEGDRPRRRQLPPV